MGANMGPKSCHIPGYRPFPRMRIWHNVNLYGTKGFPHPKGLTNNQNKYVSGVEAVPQAGTYTFLIVSLTGAMYRAL